MASPTLCTVTGTVESAVDNEAREGILVRWSHSGFTHDDRVIPPESKEVITDAAGLWTIDLAETETIGLSPYSVEFVRSGDQGGIVYSNLLIPDQASETWDNIGRNAIANPFAPSDTQKIAAVKDLVIEQGSNWRPTITVKDSGGSAVDLTGTTEVQMQIRSVINSNVIIADWKLTTGEFSIPTPTNGEILANVDDSVTALLKSGGFYDIELTDFDAAGRKTRLLEGRVAVTPETTR